MLGVAAVAITIPDAYAGHHQNFAIAFAIIELLITYLWWSVGIYDPSHRVFNIYYTVNYLIAFALLIASIFFTNEIATILWVIVLLLNLTPGLIGARTVVTVLKQRGQVFSASAALVERFGLFTIIVLAESILGTVNGIAEVKDKVPAAWIAFILGILISFLLWSIYFDMTSEQETKQGYGYLQWLIFLHFPLLAALGVVYGTCALIVRSLCIDTALLATGVPRPGLRTCFRPARVSSY
jgi:low temperature requirement protein LtrA